MKIKFETIELDIVDFETAVDLTNIGCFLKSKKSYVKHSDGSISKINNIGVPPNMYPAPELELVSKWFMEKHDINITICILRREVHSTWYYNIDRISVDKILHRWNPKLDTYLTYEEALSKAIKDSILFVRK